MKKTLAAVDIGAGSGRIFTGSYDGRDLSVSEAYRFVHRPVDIGKDIYLNFLHIWDCVKHGLRLSAAEHGNITSVGIDSFTPDFCLFDEDGLLLGNPLSYRTMIGSGILDHVYGIVPPREMFGYTGIQGNEILMLPQLLHIIHQDRGWLLEKSTTLPLANALEYLLTGEMSMDFTAASVSMLWDSSENKFSQELIRKYLGCADFLPVIGPNQCVKGKISAVSGLEEMTGVPVINSGVHDTAVATYTLDFLAKGQICMNCGTWTSISVVVDRPVINDEAFSCGLTNYGLPNGKYMFGKVMLGMFYLQECRAEWEQAGKAYSYDQLNALAETSIPFIVDFDDPVFDESGQPMTWRIRQYFIRKNQPYPETVGEYTRCIIESLVLKYEKTIKALENSLGHCFSAVYMGGGGIKSTLLCECLERVTHKELVRTAPEVTVMGNLLSQLTAAGEIAEGDAEWIIRPTLWTKI